MKASYPLEALKAQAVVARTWAMWRIMSGGRLASQVQVDVFDGNDDPAYEGTGEGGQNIASALDDTRGKPLFYLGRPFPAFYHAASGGKLAAISEVFPSISGLSGESLAGVMPGGEDPDCDRGVMAMGAKDRLGSTRVSFSSADLRGPLMLRDSEPGYIRDVIPDGKTPGRPYRVKRLALVATRGRNMILGPEEFRNLMGPGKIPSMLWSDTSPALAEQANYTWNIVTYGRGHGVGMSQASAYAMAKQQMKYQEILARFYKGAKIGSAQW
jgi:peptidoglycan hydrolase-like amidase